MHYNSLIVTFLKNNFSRETVLYLYFYGAHTHFISFSIYMFKQYYKSRINTHSTA